MKTFPIQKAYVQGPDFITLTAEDLQEQLVFAEANNVDGFSVHPDKNILPNLDFLPDHTRGLSITFEGFNDISALNRFRKLEVLQTGWMSYPNSEIDLSNFPDMRVLEINWNKNFKSLDKLTNVMRLYLWAFKPKSRNMEAFQNWNKLVYATFVQPGVDNLDGIENLPVERAKHMECSFS